MDEMTKRLLLRKLPTLALTAFLLFLGWLATIAGIL